MRLGDQSNRAEVRWRLNPYEVNRLGILLGDKKAGPFNLEVEWIKVKQSE